MAGTAYAVETPKPITNLTCNNNDGSTALSAAVYAYNFETGMGNPRYFAVYLNGTMFEQLLIEEYSGSPYYDCYLANNNGTHAITVTVVDVTAVGVGVDVDAGVLSEDSIKQVFTEVDFSYAYLSYVANSNVKSKAATTPEEQEKALEEQKAFQAYKARAFSMPKR